MRPEENNPLDLNNLPDDPSRDSRRVFEEGSSAGGSRERRSKDGKEYECRFCSLKFCKSQALGGHMNRHRQERETESLNKARELVLRNENFPSQGAPPFCYHPAGVHVGDTTLYRPVYLPRPFSTATSSSSCLPPPLPQPYFYPPPPPSPPSRFLPYHTNDYYLDHSHGGAELPLYPRHQTLNESGTATRGSSASRQSSYTFIGAPVGRGPPPTPPHRGL